MNKKEPIEEIQLPKKLELARTQFNSYVGLIETGRLDDAQAFLEDSLEVFRVYKDVQSEAFALGALALVWDKKEDWRRATALVQRSLAIFNRVENPVLRLFAHHNLSKYLWKLNRRESSMQHILAALAYAVAARATNHASSIVVSLNSHIAKQNAAGQPCSLPTLNELFSDAEFEYLRIYLSEERIAVSEIQTVINTIIKEAADAR